MLNLETDEKVLLIIRRHWFVMVGPTVFLVAVLILPSIFFTAVPYLYPGLFQNPKLEPIINFLLNIYILGVLLYLFIMWSDYYLDVWIITNKRLIDIEQLSLFTRHISEMYLANVQNVTVEINGFIPTMLKFGNLIVETASEGKFRIKDAPNLYEAKDLILKYSNNKN